MIEHYEPLEDWERHVLMALVMRAVAEHKLRGPGDQRLIALLRKLEGADKRLWVTRAWEPAGQ
jgi:hypothetical protein